MPGGAGGIPDGPAGEDRLQPGRVLRVYHQAAPVPDPGPQRGHAGRRLTALQVDMLADTGAYASFGPGLMIKTFGSAAGPYRWPSVELHGRVAFTNNPTAGCMRGPGTTQVVFASSRRWICSPRARHGSPRVPGVEPASAGRPGPVRPGPGSRPRLCTRRSRRCGPTGSRDWNGARTSTGRAAAAWSGGRLHLVRHRRRGRGPGSRPGPCGHGRARTGAGRLDLLDDGRSFRPDRRQWTSARGRRPRWP